MGATISVIIPVYDVAEYLPQCVDSVRAQTYRNLEIILVDDGSTDGSGDICDRCAAQDGRIRVIHKPNGGVSSARNAGLQACTGQYIGFVDSDDWIEPEMYQKLMSSMGGVDLAACGYFEYPTGALDVAVRGGTKRVPPCGAEEAAVRIYERHGYFISVCNKLYRRDAVFPGGEMIAMDTSLAFGEDEQWLAGVLRHCDRFAFVPEPLYHWRPRAGSVTRFDRVTDRQMTVLAAKEKAMALLPQTEAVQRVFRARMYNDCHLMKVISYAVGDRAKMKTVAQAIAPMWKEWLRAPDIPLLRKLKVMLLELEMRLGLPGDIVRKTVDIRGLGSAGTGK